MQEQAERFGAEILLDDVVELELDGRRQDASRSAQRRRVRGPHGDLRDRLRLPQARHRRARTACPATASRGAPRATASSSGRRRSPSSAAATPRWRRPPSSPASRTRSTSSTAATPCARPRSCRSARSTTRRSSSSGTRRSTRSCGDELVDRRAPRRHDRRPGPRAAARRRCSSRSATTRARDLVQGQLDLTAEGTIAVDGRSSPHQRCPASSPRAT